MDNIARDGEILIVDEFTGLVMEGRRYSNGLHQAIEAKEHVKNQSELQNDMKADPPGKSRRRGGAVLHPHVFRVRRTRSAGAQNIVLGRYTENVYVEKKQPNFEEMRAPNRQDRDDRHVRKVETPGRSKTAEKSLATCKEIPYNYSN